MLSLLLVVASLGAPSIQELIPPEKGFDGAVTVAKAIQDGAYGVVTVEIPYLDVHGNKKAGQARLIVRMQDLDHGRPLPIFFHAHYEKPVDAAKHFCDQGWAVATAHYKDADGGYPIDVSVGDGYNLAHAIIQWVRRLSFLDRTHLHIDGGSQGGYMALAMSADAFPVSATTADVPVVNWDYNFRYLEANRTVAKYPLKDFKESPLPFIHVVMGLADMGYEVFGRDLSAETWYRLSPISYLDHIANPVLVMCATGDMLVPMEQMTKSSQYLHPFDPAKFPEGYQRDFDALTPCPKARVRFEDVIPAKDVSIAVMPLQKDSYQLDPAYFDGKKKKPEKGPTNQERPWSSDHQWSVCILDEGAPLPVAGHTGYEWAASPDSFVAAHLKERPAPSILNAAKLRHLMERYQGELSDLPTLADGKTGNRLNFQTLERRDVLAGLLDYAGLGEDYEKRLESLYADSTLKPLGATLNLGRVKEELAGLSGQKSK